MAQMPEPVSSPEAGRVEYGWTAARPIVRPSSERKNKKPQPIRLPPKIAVHFKRMSRPR